MGRKPKPAEVWAVYRPLSAPSCLPAWPRSLQTPRPLWAWTPQARHLAIPAVVPVRAGTWSRTRIGRYSQRAMSQWAESTIVEVMASHAIYITQPELVADLIKQATSAVTRQ
jgi:hypothetical protein